MLSDCNWVNQAQCIRHTVSPFCLVLLQTACTSVYCVSHDNYAYYFPLSHCMELWCGPWALQDRAIGSIYGVHWSRRGWECMHSCSLAVSSLSWMIWRLWENIAIDAIINLLELKLVLNYFFCTFFGQSGLLSLHYCTSRSQVADYTHCLTPHVAALAQQALKTPHTSTPFSNTLLS